MTTLATLVGCAIGDALGNPFEMRPATDPMITEWDGTFIEGGTFWHGQPGQYTDDTLMSMALAASLLERQGYDPEDAAQKYLAWKESGNTRGIGGTTSAALMRVKLGAHYTESGLILNPDGTPVGGNGTAMRASPIGLVYRNDLQKLLGVAMEDASITHNSLEPKMGSIAVALGTAYLAKEMCHPKHLASDVASILPDCEMALHLLKVSHHLREETDPALALPELMTLSNKGYVPETVATAFYCLGATDNFRDCVIMAVRAGGDTDTTAAIAGALAGTWYGEEGIPEEYKSVEDRELLQILTNELINIEI